jgi:hypothetical protein
MWNRIKYPFFRRGVRIPSIQTRQAHIFHLYIAEKNSDGLIRGILTWTSAWHALSSTTCSSQWTHKWSANSNGTEQVEMDTRLQYRRYTPFWSWERPILRRGVCSSVGSMAEKSPCLPRSWVIKPECTINLTGHRRRSTIYAAGFCWQSLSPFSPSLWKVAINLNLGDL